MEKERAYLAIDLKSFYASVECVERQLDPLATHLVVADAARTDKTICLAVSPSLKAYGIPGRPRLFEVIRRVDEINLQRKADAPGRVLTGSSHSAPALAAHPALALSYITATPRMAFYMEYSTAIYNIYLKYIAPEDIHVYSIDEVFMDVTDYLNTYHTTPRGLASIILRDVLETTGITAAAGIGTNLYLCKVAMDIVAKHVTPDADGACIAELDELRYRQLLWDHRPLTDFWRVGRGYRKKLEAVGLYTMGDIARCSLGTDRQYHNEELLYKLFGVNAELLIDHAWGFEPTTIAQIKAYRPETNSLSMGQVLPVPYEFEKGKLIVREMTDSLVLELVEKRLVTDQIVLSVGYENRAEYAHGSTNISRQTSSGRLITDAVMQLYARIVNPKLSIRRVTVAANHVVDEALAGKADGFEQLDLFTDYAAQKEAQQEEDARLSKERKLQEAMLSVKKKYGKNAVLKGTSLQEGATAAERNRQIGGHRA